MPHSPDALRRVAPHMQLVAPVSGYREIEGAGLGQRIGAPPPAALRHRTWSPRIFDVIWQRCAMPQSPDAQRRSAPKVQLVAPVSGYSEIEGAGAGQRIGCPHRRHSATALGRPAFLIPFGSVTPCQTRRCAAAVGTPPAAGGASEWLQWDWGGWGRATNGLPPTAALRRCAWQPGISDTIWQRCVMPHSPDAQRWSAPNRAAGGDSEWLQCDWGGWGGATNRLPPPAALRHRTWSPRISDVIWQRCAMPNSPEAQRRLAPNVQLVAPVSGWR